MGSSARVSRSATAYNVLPSAVPPKIQSLRASWFGAADPGWAAMASW